jgi:hypothetical protein
MMSDINKIMEAYLGMVSGEKTVDEAKIRDKGGIQGKDGKRYTVQMNQDKGKLSFKLTNEFGDFKTVSAKQMGKLFEEVELEEVSEKKLDPVDDKANDKKFADRKDKDIDNDGDVDSSDEYLHKKRAATDDAIDGGKKPAKKEEVEKDEEESEEEPKDKKKKPFPPKKKDDDSEEEPDAEPEADGDSDIKKNPKTADKKAEISKIESVEFRSAFEEMWSAFAEAADPKKGALAGEKHDDHSSEHDKKVIAMHKKSEKKIEDNEEDSHNKTFKAGGKDMKQSPARSGADNLSNGDKTPVK